MIADESDILCELKCMELFTIIQDVTRNNHNYDIRDMDILEVIADWAIIVFDKMTIENINIIRQDAVTEYLENNA